MLQRVVDRYEKTYGSHREVACDIESMFIRGANDIARMAGFGLWLFADGYSGRDGEYFEGLLEAARYLYRTRPTAVSLENALLYVLNCVDEAGDRADGREETKRAAEEFYEFAVEAQKKVAAEAASLIEDGYTVHTHCNSTAVVSALRKAHGEGKGITVHTTESRPRYQGRITARELSEAGIRIKMMVDSAARLYMEEADMVMVGADTITADGTLYNKIGTWQIALAADDRGIPLYVLGESFKFSGRSEGSGPVKIENRDAEEVVDPGAFPGVEILNPAFDRTPARLIEGFVTERGVIDPENTKTFAAEVFRGMRTDHLH